MCMINSGLSDKPKGGQKKLANTQTRDQKQKAIDRYKKT